MVLHRALFALDAERAHGVGLKLLNLLPSRPANASPRLETALAGMNLPHPIGLAAGFDKNATAVRGFAGLGFAYVEVGTVTPRPQVGNPRPRLFRLETDAAIINRLGFNNDGVATVGKRLRALGSRPVPLGINIGMNKDSREALPDYLTGMNALSSLADYITLNVSSPNTPGLRALQQVDRLRDLLRPVLERRAELARDLARRLPVFLKIAPDLSIDEALAIAELARDLGIDALMISNTTIDRPATLSSPARVETGGLSGKPLMQPSTALLREVRRGIGKSLPLIGIGGIFKAEDVLAKILAGATAVQLYSGLVYEGPGLVRRLVRDLDRLLDERSIGRLAEAIGADA
ncbi:dihydroorotate oxidase A [Arboricoccus pini]|uniref:Dihydroorotate dehydrogenase (quinone) n=1 Tax=Arboricoccus pini TaxID=1963835 RepID=A0A212QPG0_9PROT|nr:quinone-dependent dihydroorotate dehydrogenase [Arboricoccus pini]SNB61336.1 dihydroorotate oxidase A [Arboricoccus pini]